MAVQVITGIGWVECIGFGHGVQVRSPGVRTPNSSPDNTFRTIQMSVRRGIEKDQPDKHGRFQANTDKYQNRRTILRPLTVPRQGAKPPARPCGNHTLPTSDECEGFHEFDLLGFIGKGINISEGSGTVPRSSRSKTATLLNLQ